ncbi:MAG: FtsW/RodA/SpoVE family cell cycle protein [Bacillota bacterium]|nr:FtsW/RodA/SpoVE family cell cycle protein [Bacillota bacterium]
MGLLYRTWFGLTGWIVGVVLWLFILQGQVLWWQPAALWALFMVLWLITRQLGADSGALPFTAVLVFCGWVFLARLDPALAQGHFYGAMLGAVLYLFGLLVPAIRFPFTRLWAWAALGLLAVTAIWGESAGGARAWLSVGSLRFQPVELAKIFLIFYLGRQLRREQAPWEHLFFLTCFCLLAAWQRDLGPAVLVFAVFGWLSLWHSFSWYKLLGWAAAAAGGFCGAVGLFSHVQNRVLAWLKPWDYLDSKGYQVLQGLFALRAGGLVGQGLGQGLVRVIPHGHTDYIFAVLGEEFGFLGVCALLLCYLSLAFWALRILDGLDQERQLVGLGLTLLLHGQVVLVVGGILRLLPFTGMTLPFVSFGSTSLAAQFWMLGTIAGWSRGGGEA